MSCGHVVDDDRDDEVARGRPEVLDVVVAEHRHGFVAGQVGAIDRVAARRALQQEHVRGGGAEGLGERRRRAAPESLDVRERHRVLGVVEQRDREAHADASPGRVDRERRLGRDGHLVGRRPRRATATWSRSAGIRMPRPRPLDRPAPTTRVGPARRSRAAPASPTTASTAMTTANATRNARPRRLRARPARVGALSTHTGPRARRSARPKTHRSRAAPSAVELTVPVIVTHWPVSSAAGCRHRNTRRLGVDHAVRDDEPRQIEAPGAAVAGRDEAGEGDGVAVERIGIRRRREHGRPLADPERRSCLPWRRG